MAPIDSLRGRIALMVGHCAGMVDLVALPVWVGGLMAHHRFAPQQAGLLATLFLAAAVAASLLLAPRFGRLNGRLVATTGFGGAAACFAVLATLTDFRAMAGLHALAGFCAGAALSVTHGTIARSGRPHRLFALVGMALGVFAVVFLGAAAPLVAQGGTVVLFGAFAAVMAAGALAAGVGFPGVAGSGADPVAGAAAPPPPARRLPAGVWFGIAGIAAMALVQAMTFSFLERVGQHRGFDVAAITGVLVALGLVNLTPAALAAVLEKRWPAQRVLLAGPVIQALLVVVIMNATAFGAYAAAASVFAAVMIFTHTFAFGLLARLDPSGRALAATPAMLMTGAAIGPVLGGTLVQGAGYGSLGLAALAVGSLAVVCFSRVQTAPAPQGAPA